MCTASDINRPWNKLPTQSRELWIPNAIHPSSENVLPSIHAKIASADAAEHAISTHVKLCFSDCQSWCTKLCSYSEASL